MSRNRMSYSNLHDVSIEEEVDGDKRKYSPPDQAGEPGTPDNVELVTGQYPLNVKFVKWQDSKIGQYIEFKIIVFYQEGPGVKKLIDFARDSIIDDKPSNIYQWVIYKRYSNFVDLNEALKPYFKAD